MFYVGNTFDEKANKGYKTIQNAKKAAEKDGLSVWDEEGVKLYPLKVEVTDDVPDDAALEEKPDGSVNAYDETGEKVGEVSAEEVKEIMDEITAEDVEAAAAAARSEEEVHGTIRRVFEGRLRLRRRPSFEDDAICGVTMFDEKKVEKKAKIGDRVLYKTTDGYWIQEIQNTQNLFRRNNDGSGIIHRHSNRVCGVWICDNYFHVINNSGSKESGRRGRQAVL